MRPPELVLLDLDDTLRDARYRLAVATSKLTPFVVRIMEHFGLDQYVDLVVGASLDGSRRTKVDIIECGCSHRDLEASRADMLGWPR